MGTEGKLHQYLNFIGKLKQCMYLCGLWPVINPNVFYRLIPLVLFVLNFMTVMVTFSLCVETFQSDLEAMAKGMSVFITASATDLKILCVVFNWEDVRELHEILDTSLSEMLKDKANQESFLQKFGAVRRLSTVLIVLAFIAVGMNIVSPYELFVIQWIHHTHPIEYKLAIPAVYPYEIPGGSFLYYLHLATESMTGYAIFFIACSIDAYFPIYIYQLSGQLDTLSERLNDLRDGDDYQAVVKDCVRKHLMIIRCHEIIETIYGPVIIWMLLTTSVALCALTFQLSKSETSDFGHIFTDVTYMFSKLLQIYIYASSGASLTSASETFRDAVYVDNWPTNDRQRFLSSMGIMLTQKPLILVACSYSTVSLEMFTKVLNTTISYFLLLQTMDDERST